jgi:hypothetical protein
MVRSTGTLFDQAKRMTCLVSLAGLLIGCSLDGLLKSNTLPPDVADPALTQTPAGAVEAYRGTLGQFREAFAGQASTGGGVVGFGGLLTDELQSGSLGSGNGLGTSGIGGDRGEVDARSLPELFGTTVTAEPPNMAVLDVYSDLQKVRGQAAQAIGLLVHFGPSNSAPLIGRLYAVQGYAEVFLAEVFCSGIPLSTVNYAADYTLEPGSPSEAVYADAIALFDTAASLAGDSTRFRQLALIGQARAWLDLGDFAKAAGLAAQVPDGYRYTVTFTAEQPAGNVRNFNALNFIAVGPLDPTRVWEYTVADREGLNGLAYRTDGDPRTAAYSIGTNASGQMLYAPNKYSGNGDSPIILADWIEARLIQAEAALRTGDPRWLVMLNALRTDGSFDTQPDAQDSTRTDTLWHAGTGNVAGLAPLQDPGATDARVDLLFHERASWLFLTGHRQGDLRRLIRQYGRNAESVYPTGPYPNANGTYGTDVTAPIPPQERISNPRFTGCISRGA